MQNPLSLIPVPPPPVEQRCIRAAAPAALGERRNRYTLPLNLDSGSPIGYRTRIPMTSADAEAAAPLFSLERPTAFVPGPAITEQELFEECSLGILSARQSTNFRGHRELTFGPADSKRIAEILGRCQGLDAPPLTGAAATHVVLTRPYRTPFTLLLTFVGHKPLLSLFTVPARGWSKRTKHTDDLPSIGYLQHLHLGILADAMERAAVIASDGTRAAQVLMGPFTSIERRFANREAIAELHQMCGLSASDRAKGWRVGLVAQVGTIATPHAIPRSVLRKVGANLLAFRSERIQPGVNADERAPDAYQHRQDMDVPEELAYQAGRAAYNAFVHWTGCEREKAKNLMLLERIDVLTPGGKERLRSIRKDNNAITDNVIRDLPLWADLPLGKALSRNANRGRKAFALVGQRIYVGGLDKAAVSSANIDGSLACQALGAASFRSALVCELSGCIDLPDDCDLLAGTCIMAGPVNQNDIGKQFYGFDDLLCSAFADQDPTAMLVWTLKAKTVADPIGNEEQLVNRRRKGALVDLRPSPAEVVHCVVDGKQLPMRKRGERSNQERAFSDQGNFVSAPDGRPIPGNPGSPWPRVWADAAVWGSEG